MDFITDFFAKLHDLDALVRWGGYTVLMVIIFAETGLFFGFFLPGDSLLVTAGLFAARGVLDIWVLLILCFICAVVGDAVGFEIGRFFGKKIFQKDHRFIKREHLERTREFYEKHGGKTIVIARFMPIVRTFAPLVAGAAGMSYAQFATYNILGGLLWVGSMVGVGFALGNLVPDIDRYLHIVIIVIIFLSILPGIIEYYKTGHWKRWFETYKA